MIKSSSDNVSNVKLCFTAITVIRGETDIAYSSLYHHASLGFNRLIIISHVEHLFLRECAHMLRQEFADLELVVVEIDAIDGFSRFKGQWVNGALSMFLDPQVTNIVYGFDADEFLHISTFGSIDKLIGSFAREANVDSLVEQPALLQLPWANLLPCNPSEVSKDNDLSRQFHEASYLKLVSKSPILSKMIFVYKPGIRIHMGYHFLINAKTKQRIKMHTSSEHFVATHGLCVHHIPFRKMDQFRNRISAYRTSASKNAKYNRIDDSGGELAEAIFKACMETTPQYKNLEAARVGLKYEFDNQRDKTFIEYLLLPRLNVGKILLPRLNQIETSLASLPPSLHSTSRPE